MKIITTDMATLIITSMVDMEIAKVFMETLIIMETSMAKYSAQ